jgi:hypothetical protein
MNDNLTLSTFQLFKMFPDAVARSARLASASKRLDALLQRLYSEVLELLS